MKRDDQHEISTINVNNRKGSCRDGDESEFGESKS